jgi:hypothetical protein
MRGDMTGALGWLNANKDGLTTYDSWYNRSLYGGLAAGWYWTDHLKTELEAGASTEAELYRARQIIVDGISSYESAELTFRTMRLSVTQQYQFFRNAWFHPHVAAGVDFTWERTVERIEPVVVFDPQFRFPREIRPARVIGPETRLEVRPFSGVGFKAYMTRRAFFRNDVRVAVGKGVDEVVVRFGFGVDF